MLFIATVHHIITTKNIYIYQFALLTFASFVGLEQTSKS